MSARELFERYREAVYFVAVETPSGAETIGTAFHVGEGILITARHVVEGNRIVEIGCDPNSRQAAPRLVSGPYWQPQATADVAALVTKVDSSAPTVPLGSHLDDWLNDPEWVLRSALVLGYPRISFTQEPLLVAARAEINAVVDTRVSAHPSFLVSAMPRGGFSGAPCLIEWDFALGVVTEALMADHTTPELGFMAVLTVEPIFVCLQAHSLVPKVQKGGWDGFWD